MRRTGFSKFITFCIITICCGIIFYYKDKINDYIIKNAIYIDKSSEYVANEYAKRQNYEYSKIVDNFTAHSNEDLINIIYTVLDSGNTKFSFFCAEDYTNCHEDIENLSINHNQLAILNNFVHPYNSYNKLYISTNNLGKITLSIQKLYTDEEIKYIEDSINLIETQIINDTMNTIDKIKTFHDYIINNTVYDSIRAEEIKNNLFNSNDLQSHKAYGVLKNNIALCSGYTDIMTIYLDRLGVKNYKVANEDHVWNALYIDDVWYHLDLTWDDPVTSNGTNLLLHDFFIITTDSLFSKDNKHHNYDINIYKEL